jgi:hypothetical protein
VKGGVGPVHVFPSLFFFLLIFFWFFSLNILIQSVEKQKRRRFYPGKVRRRQNKYRHALITWWSGIDGVCCTLSRILLHEL